MKLLIHSHTSTVAQASVHILSSYIHRSLYSQGTFLWSITSSNFSYTHLVSYLQATLLRSAISSQLFIVYLSCSILTGYIAKISHQFATFYRIFILLHTYRVHYSNQPSVHSLLSYILAPYLQGALLISAISSQLIIYIYSFCHFASYLLGTFLRSTISSQLVIVYSSCFILTRHIPKINHQFTSCYRIFILLYTYKAHS